MSEQFSNLEGLKVMVIDDAKTMTRAAEIYLKGEKGKETGMIIKTAREGYDAIPDIFEFEPDIIFLDVMMEKVDGFTICKAIKSNPRLRKIIVIMLTSKEGVMDKARGRDSGADAYVTKPFKREEILAIVSKYADQKRAA